MTQPLAIKWLERHAPLEPAAVIGFGAAARRLKHRLLALDDENLATLQGVFAADLLFAAGAAENLPWADGVIYLGRDPAAPSILLPTNRRPNAPVDLFEKSLLARFSGQKPFVVVENRIVEIGEMRPIARRVLREIL